MTPMPESETCQRLSVRRSDPTASRQSRVSAAGQVGRGTGWLPAEPCGDEAAEGKPHDEGQAPALALLPCAKEGKRRTHRAGHAVAGRDAEGFSREPREQAHDETDRGPATHQGHGAKNTASYMAQRSVQG